MNEVTFLKNREVNIAEGFSATFCNNFSCQMKADEYDKVYGICKVEEERRRESDWIEKILGKQFILEQTKK